MKDGRDRIENKITTSPHLPTGALAQEKCYHQSMITLVRAFMGTQRTCYAGCYQDTKLKSPQGPCLGGASEL